MLKNGEGDAFVSAGSTGALHVGTSLIVRTVKGVKRPALATPMPGAKQNFLLLDCGANVECRPEGELTRMRASLVSEDALFQFAQEIHLGEYLRLGHGEDLGGGRNRPSVVSDAFEAVIAALYLDGGMETARNFILPFITEGKTAEDDYKTRLQEVVQQDPSAVLKYEVTGETGPDHNKQFTVCVWRNGELLAEGRGRSKKAAEQHAAKTALEKL